MSKTLTKSAFIDRIAQANELPKSTVARLLESMATTCQEELRTNGAVAVPGLVKFKMRSLPARPERQGVNPFTKAAITIPARGPSKKVKASPIKAFSEALTNHAGT
jgi:nucleoid DNA-binding protein